MSLLLLCISFWAFLGALEISSQLEEVKITLSKIQYLGILPVGPLWLLFSLDIIGIREKYFNKKKILLLFLFPLLMLLAVLTNEFHYLFWSSLEMTNVSFGKILLYSPGIISFLNIIYSYVLLLLGGIILFKYVLSSGRYKRAQIVLVIVATIIPWIANILYLLKLNILGGIELTPLAFSITGILLSISMFKFKLFELIPLAKDLIFNKINIGFIIINNDNKVVEFNNAALDILNLKINKGEDIILALEEMPDSLIELLKQEGVKEEIELLRSGVVKWIECNIDRIGDDKSIEGGGKVLSLHDITRRKEYEKNLLKSQSNLTAVIENTEDIIKYIDREEKLVICNSAYKKAVKGIYNIDIKIGDSSIIYLNNEEKIWWQERNYRCFNGEKFKDEWSKQVGDNTLYFEISFNPVKFEDVVIGLTTYTRNVTDRKMFEVQLQEKVRELEKVNNIMIGRESKMVELKNILKEKGLDITIDGVFKDVNNKYKNT